MVYTQGAMNPANVMDPYNYVRPTNQLVFLLQKGLDMPPYPIELSDSIPEKVWYSRMDKLHAALARAWHWTEKALFSFAFVMSIVMVSLMTLRHVHKLTTIDSPGLLLPSFRATWEKTAPAGSRATKPSIPLLQQRPLQCLQHQVPSRVLRPASPPL